MGGAVFPPCCLTWEQTHLNAKFQRIARRDKKAFLSDQCKEIEENNIIGKTRDLVKKIRDTKGTFHAKLGSIKDRNGMDLTEAEDVKKSFDVWFSSVIQSCLTLCDWKDCNTQGLPVHHLLPELAQTHVHQVNDAIQPSHPLSSPSPAFNLQSQQNDLHDQISMMVWLLT